MGLCVSVVFAYKLGLIAVDCVLAVCMLAMLRLLKIWDQTILIPADLAIAARHAHGADYGTA